MEQGMIHMLFFETGINAPEEQLTGNPDAVLEAGVPAERIMII